MGPLLLFITFALSAMHVIEHGPSHVSPNGFSHLDADLDHNVQLLPLELKLLIGEMAGIQLYDYFFPRALTLQIEKIKKAEGCSCSPSAFTRETFRDRHNSVLCPDCMPMIRKTLSRTCAVSALRMKIWALEPNIQMAIIVDAEQRAPGKNLQNLMAADTMRAKFMPRALVVQQDCIHRISCHPTSSLPKKLLNPRTAELFVRSAQGKILLEELKRQKKAKVEALTALQLSIAPLTLPEFYQAHGAETLRALYGRLSKEVLDKNLPTPASCKLCNAKTN